ncbi:hypothetical protein MHU86_20149 [Fragilaria crotonensis]|nr:hypothetical protein MHU86_20149 [Fragilaria crotonensis]
MPRRRRSTSTTNHGRRRSTSTYNTHNRFQIETPKVLQEKVGEEMTEEIVKIPGKAVSPAEQLFSCKMANRFQIETPKVLQEKVGEEMTEEIVKIPGKAVSPAEQLFSCKMADASVCGCDAY